MHNLTDGLGRDNTNPGQWSWRIWAFCRDLAKLSAWIFHCPSLLQQQSSPPRLFDRTLVQLMTAPSACFRRRYCSPRRYSNAALTPIISVSKNKTFSQYSWVAMLIAQICYNTGFAALSCTISTSMYNVHIYVCVYAFWPSLFEIGRLLALRTAIASLQANSSWSCKSN